MDTPEQALYNHAYIMGQCMSCMVEMQAMIAENRYCEDQGLARAYNEDDFMRLQEKYAIGHNAVILTFFPDRR